MNTGTKWQHAALTVAERRMFQLSLKNAAKRGDSFSVAAVLLLDQLSDLPPQESAYDVLQRVVDKLSL